MWAGEGGQAAAGQQQRRAGRQGHALAIPEWGGARVRVRSPITLSFTPARAPHRTHTPCVCDISTTSMATLTCPRPAAPAQPAGRGGRSGSGRAGPAGASPAAPRRAPARPAAEPAFGGRVPQAPYVCLGEGLFGAL